MKQYENEIYHLNSTLSDSIPHVLHHYTDMQSTIGIINKKEIWFTNIEFLNDVSEFNQGKDLFTKFLKLSEKDFVCRRTYEEILSSVEAEVSPEDYFSFSLSEISDSLEQWRAYAGNENGVMLSMTNLFNHLESYGIIPIKIIYKDDHFKQKINAVISILQNWKLDFDDPKLFFFWGKLHDFLAKLFLTKKDGSFENEQEWKLIYSHREIDDAYHKADIDPVEKNIRFRASSDYLIPYSILNIEKISKCDLSLFVTKIIISPVNKVRNDSMQNNRTVNGLKKLLKQNKINNAEDIVDFSKLPYR